MTDTSLKLVLAGIRSHDTETFQLLMLQIIKAKALFFVCEARDAAPKTKKIKVTVTVTVTVLVIYAQPRL